MSQHSFDTVHNGFPITVLLGWDRPLNYFFLVIQKRTTRIDEAMQAEDGDILYSNLHENEPFNHDLEYYREVLGNFQILVPESMFIEVQHDLVSYVGNRVAKHQVDGSFTEQTL
ncbi:hypothetical protein PQR66_09330 [Paraburkholderia agricolaris]|jgi:hypothetical protein|uniref:Uncharacterized protein n=1 Tax=Paraburkholderia agricolaris TaxID=2152888 RepID=A0ABW8ZJT0_9BURK